MGGFGSKEAYEAKLASLRATEEQLLKHGLDWWRGVRETGGSEAPHTIAYNVADVVIEPEEERHALLHSEQQKYGKPLHIHTVQYGTSEDALDEDHEEAPIVLLHGYGSGIGIFATSIGPLTHTLNRRVYAIDGLGCGLSARPRWTLGYADADLDQVEEYSADAIDLWRQKIGAEKIVLCGHSVGGYLSVAYAERYPQHVEKLVLISPAGVASQPPDDKSKPRSTLFKVARFLWGYGLSPLAISKYMTGRVLIDQYVNRRFPNYDWFNKPLFADYLTGIWTYDEPSAGAYHHTTLLLPGVYGRRPLKDRIRKLKVERVAAIYGTNDWMNPSRFVPIVEEHEREKRKLSARSAQEPQSEVMEMEVQVQDGEATVDDLQLMLVDGAGHNLQLDNPLAFVAAMEAYILRQEVCTGKTFRHQDFQLPQGAAL